MTQIFIHSEVGVTCIHFYVLVTEHILVRGGFGKQLKTAPPNF